MAKSGRLVIRLDERGRGLFADRADAIPQSYDIEPQSPRKSKEIKRHRSDSREAARVSGSPHRSGRAGWRYDHNSEGRPV